jgi:hypothetical protein
MISPSEASKKAMKYILSLTDKNPQNNMVLECEDEEEMNKYYMMAIQQGYKVTVREEPDDSNVCS